MMGDQVHMRLIYLEKVKPYIDKKILKVFTGQRRVGKSYLLFQIMEFLKAKETAVSILYINKEDLAFSSIKDSEDLNAYVLAHKSKTQKTYLFIDEIQDILEFQLALRSLLLHDDLDIYCTGSNANMLSSDIAGNLSGRYIEIEVHSLSYLEFLDFHHLEDENISVEKFLKYGGLPYLKHLPLTDQVIFEYLKNIYNTIVYKDVVNRYGIRNGVFLEQLLVFLSGNIGSLFSSKKISDFLKSQKVSISPSQVSIYLSHLTQAFLIDKVSRYDIVGKRVFEIGEKYYFENLGIRNGILGYRIEDRAKILENAVYNHLKILGYMVKVGVLEAYEIDFIAEKNGEREYFQVALTLNDPKTIEREFGSLKKIKDNYPKSVITYDTFEGNTFEGIVCLDIRSFLNRMN